MIELLNDSLMIIENVVQVSHYNHSTAVAASPVAALYNFLLKPMRSVLSPPLAAHHHRRCESTYDMSSPTRARAPRPYVLLLLLLLWVRFSVTFFLLST